eukprot:scaffold5391_cov171-Amphora_coffeaeformis.AAC.7
MDDQATMYRLLSDAVRMGDASTVSFLLEKGARADRKVAFKDNLLCVATTLGDYKKVCLCYNVINSPWYYDKKPFKWQYSVLTYSWYGCYWKKPTRTPRSVIQMKSFARSHCTGKVTKDNQASGNTWYKVGACLIKAGAHPNIKSEKSSGGLTPLLLACEDGHL